VEASADIVGKLFEGDGGRICWVGVLAEPVLRSASDARCDSFLDCTLTIVLLSQTWSEICRYWRRNVGVKSGTRLNGRDAGSFWKLTANE
jgi:hypothetical protein